MRYRTPYAARPLAVFAGLLTGFLTAMPCASAVASPLDGATISSTVRFAADSGDACRRGFTEGTLTWPDMPVVPPTVHVAGRLVDEMNTPCSPDGRYSVATFTAYAGNVVADKEERRADNQQVILDFQLTGTSSTAGIDRVVVQVCRHAVLQPTFYCGAAHTYWRP